MPTFRSSWIVFFISVAVSFWVGYWLGGSGGELAEIRDRFSWTGFFLGVMIAFPIAYIVGTIAEHERTYRLPPARRLFEEMRAQLEYLERLWKQSGDEFERVQKELTERKGADELTRRTKGRDG
jgi:hypothetical protein